LARKLIVEIVADASGYTRGIAGAERATKEFTSAVNVAKVSIGALAKSFVVLEAFDAAFRGVTEAVHAGIGEFKESSQIQAQTAAALKSTGDISGKTAEQIHELSLSLSNLSGQSDESIQAAENVLLSFTNIRDSLGKNNDIFTQATKTVVDFSARTGKDAPAAAVLLGKALQDPAKRVGILARAGVVLTKSQTDYLKSVESSKGILAAQKILLGDLSDRFSGAAAAAGKTLPGALDILKERFRDLAGEGVAAVAPALTNVANGLAGFVVKLTEAHGATAKFHVATAGLKDLGRQVFDTLKSGFERIDWSKLFDRAGDIAGLLLSSMEAQVQRVDWTGLARTVGDRIKAVNWRAVIQEAANGLTVAVVGLLNTLTRALQAVDWEKVGKVIADGLVLAVAAVAKFLADVDWSKVIRALARGLLAAADAAGALFEGIAKEIGRFILDGLTKGLTAAGKSLEATALRIALKIVEPFTHLPDFLGGKTFQDLQKTMQTELASLGTAGETFAQQAARQIAQGYVTGLQSEQATIVKTFQDFFAGIATPAALEPISDAALSGPTASTQPYRPAAPDIGAGAGGKKRKGISQSQRNTFFDNMISRLLDQAQDGTIQQQIAKLKAVGALITARIAATKDVTRKLTLEQTLLDQVTRPLKADRAQISQNKLDWAQYGVDRTALTDNLQDNLKALESQQKIIKDAIRTQGHTLQLMNALLQVQLAIKQKRKDIAGATDPLAGLMQVSSRQLASILAQGTGLGVQGQRILGMNIAGAAIQPLHVHVNIDGREIGSVVTKQQARTSRRTAAQTSGHRG
jgi:hypothetical protein